MWTQPLFSALQTEEASAEFAAADLCCDDAGAGAGGSAPLSISGGSAGQNPASAAGVTDAAAALLAGSDWRTGNGPTVITYSFATQASAYTADKDFAQTFQAFSDTDKALTRELLSTISAVCNVTFVEVADSAASHGQVRYAYSDLPRLMGYAGYAFFPGTQGNGGDVWLSKSMAATNWDWYRPDLLLHETLHAIGLKHPFDGAVTLDTQSDLIVNTVMSYSTVAGSRSGSMTEYPREPMVLDIAALQDLYGAAAHNAGDTVYDLASAQMQSNFHAVWDSGGTDTFDASGIQHGVELDLRDGGASAIGDEVTAQGYIGTGTSRTTTTATYDDTLFVAAGTTIERAIGTGFDDTIVAGAATRYIDGGAGTDTVSLAGSVDDYSIALDSGAYQFTRISDGASIVLDGVEAISFGDATLRQAALVDDSQGHTYQQAFRLYLAALDRVPDQGGLIYQTRALESGLTLPQLAGNFIASPEFQQHYGGVSDADFVGLLYHNVLDRAPDAGGLAYYLDLLGRGVCTRANVLVCFSESPENQAHVKVELAGVSAEGMLVPTLG